jgi:hypothetical protein
LPLMITSHPLSVDFFSELQLIDAKRKRKLMNTLILITNL